jgi:hypothetical protein
MKIRYRTNLKTLIAGSFLLSATFVQPLLAVDQSSIPLKQAKIIIEHNATDDDTGFQGFLDSEGWQEIEMTGPNGVVLHFEGQGKLGSLGITELFFETVEPEKSKVSIEDMVNKLPEGRYTFKGKLMENGISQGATLGVARLTHAIPKGSKLLFPIENETVQTDSLTVKWSPVTETIYGKPVNIIAYQLIIEKDEDPHPNMIGKRGLSMYLPASVTSITVPKGFLESRTVYKWEVLAIEESGNQTLTSSGFKTQ